ncbi:MAG: hypothetical protein J6B85_03235 [Lachnospiraceae bacterium]|nr:hypothetical protein [Lachnospiraceae bacterium]
MRKKKRMGKRKAEASIAAEAALAAPVVFLAWMALLYLFRVIQIQETLHYAAAEAVRTAAGYGYLVQKAESALRQSAEGEAGRTGTGYESRENRLSKQEGLESVLESAEKGIIERLVSGVSAGVFYKYSMTRYLDADWLNRSCISGGYAGIGTSGSAILSEQQCSEIVLSYRIELPFGIGKAAGIPVVQRIKVKSFTGEGEMIQAGSSNAQKETEIQVYVTESGQVYHTSKECTYISVSIAPKRLKQMEEVRNESGQRYRQCSYCIQDASGSSWVYITKYGDVYHMKMSCSQIKREVKTLTFSEAKDRYRVCSKCAKEGVRQDEPN